MEKLTLIFSAIAAIGTVITVILGIKNNRDNKKHLKNRLDAINDIYDSPLGYSKEFIDHNKIQVEKKTLEKDLKIKRKRNNKID